MKSSARRSTAEPEACAGNSALPAPALHFTARLGFAVPPMIAEAWVDGRGRPSLHRSRLLALHKSREHALRIDGDEHAFTAGQHFPFFVQDLRHVDVLPALH